MPTQYAKYMQAIQSPMPKIAFSSKRRMSLSLPSLTSIFLRSRLDGCPARRMRTKPYKSQLSALPPFGPGAAIPLPNSRFPPTPYTFVALYGHVGEGRAVHFQITGKQGVGKRRINKRGVSKYTRSTFLFHLISTEQRCAIILDLPQLSVSINVPNMRMRQKDT